MPDGVTAWWDIAQKIGFGGAFVLGIIAFALWKRLQAEWDYSRGRDKEVTGVLNSLTKLIENDATFSKDKSTEILAEIKLLKDLIKDRPK